MSSQERVLNSQPSTQPISQPATQNIDTLTQSQDGPSQQKTFIVWGRLCPIQALLKHLGRYLCIPLYPTTYTQHALGIYILRNIFDLLIIFQKWM